MKRITGIISLLLFLITGFKSNSNKAVFKGKELLWPAKRLDVSEVALIMLNKAQQALIIGDNAARTRALFGEPSNMTSEYFEAENAMAKVYHYGNNRLFFIKDRLEKYELLDAEIVVGTISGRKFKIGDKLKRTAILRKGETSELTKYFDGFQQLDQNVELSTNYKKTRLKGDLLFGALLKKNLRLLDYYLILSFNKYDQLTSIRMDHL